jgi:hypothetical protein
LREYQFSLATGAVVSFLFIKIDAIGRFPCGSADGDEFEIRFPAVKDLVTFVRMDQDCIARSELKKPIVDLQVGFSFQNKIGLFRHGVIVRTRVTTRRKHDIS